MAERGAPTPESKAFADALASIIDRWWTGLKGSTAGDEALEKLKMDIGKAATEITGTSLEDTISNWTSAAVRSIASTLRDPDMAKWMEMGMANSQGAVVAADNESQKALHTFLYREFEKAVMAIVHEVAKGIAAAIRFTSGVDIRTEDIEGIADGSSTRDDKLALGSIIRRFYDDTLINESVAKGWVDRNPGDAEWVNFQAVAGASLRIQAGDILMDAVGSKLPFNLGKPLGNIAEKLDKAIALEDAFEELVQVPLQANIQKGLEAWYNRKIKPVDFTDQQAIQAHIGYDLPRETVNKIFDNTGLRDDIRETLISMTATNLTESDINEAYQRNLLSIEQVSEQYKQKFFQEPERKIKTDLVKGTRRWQLQTKVVELLGNLYRDGVQTKDTCVPYLNALGFENDEQDLWFMQQELERKQRKWLSNAQIEDMLKHGLANVEWAIDYQVMQGMLPEDATLVYMGYLLDKFNKQLDEDCVQILKDAASPAKLIGFLLGKLPEFGIAGMFGKTELQKVLQCLLTNTKKAP